MRNRKPWSFCETPDEKCTMNYCDENGCLNRKRNLVNEDSLEHDVSNLQSKPCDVEPSQNDGFSCE